MPNTETLTLWGLKPEYVLAYRGDENAPDIDETLMMDLNLKADIFDYIEAGVAVLNQTKIQFTPDTKLNGTQIHEVILSVDASIYRQEVEVDDREHYVGVGLKLKADIDLASQTIEVGQTQVEQINVVQFEDDLGCLVGLGVEDHFLGCEQALDLDAMKAYVTQKVLDQIRKNPKYLDIFATAFS